MPSDLENRETGSADDRLQSLELVVAVQSAMIAALLKEFSAKSPSSIAVITDIVRNEISRSTEPESNEREIVMRSVKKVFDCAFDTSKTLDMIKTASSR
ncbi:hypothetical protein PTR77_14185 [Serratia bockelmannii]|uniref:hypothetical protein n=1 Tax=Serratia bockelmannii TaxID=2703793 RepID=UPI00313F0987